MSDAPHRASLGRSVETSLRVGMTFHERGDLANAEACYRGALGQVPEHPYGLHLLALAAYQRGRHTEALALVERAIARHAKDAKFHVNHGNCLRSLGRADEAVVAYERALRIDPRLSDGWNSLGNLHREAGRLDQAMAAYREGLKKTQGEVTLASNLGVALQDAGRGEEALPILEAVASRLPRDPDAHYNLGNALLALGRPKDAVDALRQATALRPAFAKAWHNLGNALAAGGQEAQAVDAFQRAVEAEPAMAKAWINLATVLAASQAGMGSERVVQAWRNALALVPESATAHCGMGEALHLLDRVEESAAAFQRAIELEPANAAAYAGLAKLLEKSGRYVEAVQCCERALAFDPGLAMAWEVKAGALWNQGLLVESSAAFREAQERAPDGGGLASNFLLSLNYLDSLAPQALAASHRERARVLDGLAGPALRLRAPGRLRVGFLSGDFRQHSVAYFLLPLLERLDRARFEIACYYVEEQEDAWTSRFRQAADLWADVKPLDDAAIAERIRADGVDVLFDLAGHTSGTRLGVFARRAAPVQASWLGYPTATGLAQMDYRLTDGAVDPGGAEPHGFERPLRLPVSYFCYGGPGIEPEVGELPARANGFITFGSFNNLAKMSPAAMRLWVRVLEALPDSRLALKSRALVDEKTAEDVLKRFEALGLGRGRLELSAWKSNTQEHLQAYGGVDIALDSTPYNGATTTCEALWMGVPVVSLAGTTHASRMGCSILRAAGLEKLVAQSEEGYVAAALRLAQDFDALALARSNLRERMKASALMDAERFAHDFGAAIETMVAGARA